MGAQEPVRPLTEIHAWDGRWFALGDRVKNLLGHQGTVSGFISAALIYVEWDVGRMTSARIADLVLLPPFGPVR